MPNKLDCDSAKLAVRISWKANEQTYIIYIYIYIYIYIIYIIYIHIYIYIYVYMHQLFQDFIKIR